MRVIRFRQPDCPGTGRKVGQRKAKILRSRDIVCPECGRVIAINYDGRIRYHVAQLH